MFPVAIMDTAGSGGRGERLAARRTAQLRDEQRLADAWHPEHQHAAILQLRLHGVLLGERALYVSGAKLECFSRWWQSISCPCLLPAFVSHALTEPGTPCYYAGLRG